MTWGPSSSGLDSRGVDLEELLSIDGVVVLFGDVRAELDGPIDPSQVRGEGPACGPVGADVIIEGHGGVASRGARGSMLLLCPPSVLVHVRGQFERSH